MRWVRNLVAALIVATVAMVALTLWQIAADTPPPVRLPVPRVQVVKVPVPGPGVTIVNHYLPVPATPPSSLRGESAPTVNHAAPTTTQPAPTRPAPPKPTPCLAAPLIGCLP